MADASKLTFLAGTSADNPPSGYYEIYIKADGTPVLLNNAGTEVELGVAGSSSLPVADTTSIAKGSVDVTKEIRFEVDGQSSGVVGVLATSFTTAKTITFPDATDTAVMLALTQTLTNKTIDANNNTISNLAHGVEVDDASTGVHGVGAATIVGTTTAQTLTNKTLTTPTIADFTNATHDHADAAGGGTLTHTDASAIHDDVAGEIAAIALKATPVSGDLLVLEDSASANAKKRVTVGSLPSSGESNTASNVGTGGVGVYKTKTGVDLEFKKINAGSSKVSITDDTGNDELDVDVVPGNILTSTLNNDAGWEANVAETNNLATDGIVGIIDDQLAVGTGAGTAAYKTLPAGALAYTLATNAFSQAASTDLSDTASIVLLTGAQTLADKTLTTPTIASMTNAQHSHADAAGGGVLNASDINDDVGWLTSEANDLATDGVVGIADDQLAVGTGAGTAAYKTLPAGALAYTLATNAFSQAASTDLSDTASIALLASAQTLTNKTIDGDNNTISNLAHGAEVDNPTTAHGATGAVVGTTNTQTLTNKSLTSPVVGTQVTLDQTTGDYTLTWADPAAGRAISITDPGGADSFVWLAASQTLTNKTLTTPTIASFANAGHDHADAAGGGTIAHSALTGVGAADHHAVVTLAGAPNYITLSGQELTLTKLDVSDDTNLIAGTGLTLATNTLSVDDDYHLHAGDVATGVHDFGGATSFEIPNGAGGTTLDAAGEVCVDTTSKTFQYYSDQEYSLNPEYVKSITIPDPEASDSWAIWYTRVAITIGYVYAFRTAGTSVTGLQLKHATTRNAAGTNIFSVSKSVTNEGGESLSGFADATIPANSWIWVTYTTVTDSVTELGLDVFYTVDP